MISTTFDTTQAIMAHIELIPGFPNEVAHQIIYGLSFLDLFRFQAVWKAWKDFIESDRTTSEIMFRFPCEIREDPNTAARTYHIEELWKEPYDRQYNGKGNSWDCVRFNPYLNLARYPGTRNSLLEAQNCTNRHFINLMETLALQKWDQTPHASLRTMMLTDPPSPVCTCTLDGLDVPFIWVYPMGELPTGTLLSSTPKESL
jgi:hypothetical protein